MISSLQNIILKELLQIPYNNEQFTNKIEAVQYNSALAITGCIRGSSREKLYSELGLESLSERRLFHRLLFLYKIINGLAPAYLKNFVPGVVLNLHNVRGHRDEWIHTRTLKYRYSSFPHAISCWHQLSSLIKNSFFKVNARSLYGIHQPIGTKLLTRLRVGLSHSRAHTLCTGWGKILYLLCLISNTLPQLYQSSSHHSTVLHDRLLLQTTCYNHLRQLLRLLISRKEKHKQQQARGVGKP